MTKTKRHAVSNILFISELIKNIYISFHLCFVTKTSYLNVYSSFEFNCAKCVPFSLRFVYPFADFLLGSYNLGQDYSIIKQNNITAEEHKALSAWPHLNLPEHYNNLADKSIFRDKTTKPRFIMDGLPSPTPFSANLARRCPTFLTAQ